MGRNSIVCTSEFTGRSQIRLSFRPGVVWKKKEWWSPMQRSSKNQAKDLTQPGIDQHDSPTIQHLIERLDRDLKESERKTTKTR